MTSAPTPPPLTPDQIARFHDDRGHTVIKVSSLIIGLSTTAVFLRFYARHSRRMSFGLDDVLAAGSLFFLILYCVTCILSVPHGMGRHSWAADPTQIWKILRMGLFNALIYFTAHWFIKMTILSFYRRVFTFRITWFKYSVYAVGAYTTAWLISSFFAGLFQCYPPAFFWEQYNPTLNPPPQGSCGAKNAPLVISTSALNTVGDVAVFSLPLAMLSRLQLNRMKKVSLFAVFATGVFAIVAGIVRLTRTLSATQLGADTTWVTADIYMWTAVEAGVALICACLPVIGPLLGLAKEKLTDLSDRRSHSRPRQRNAPIVTGKASSSKWSYPAAHALHSETLTEIELESQSTQRIIQANDEYETTTDSRVDNLENGYEYNASSSSSSRPGAHTKPKSLL